MFLAARLEYYDNLDFLTSLFPSIFLYSVGVEVAGTGPSERIGRSRRVCICREICDEKDEKYKL